MSCSIDRIDIIKKFMDLVSGAGFGRSGQDFSEFMRMFQSSEGEKLLRGFYLASIGLGEFTLNDNSIVHMVGEYAPYEDVLKFRESIWHQYKVDPRDKNIFNQEFDISKLKMVSPMIKGENEITVLEGARRMKSYKKSGVKLANVWHLYWLWNHKEFIPDEWKKLLGPETKEYCRIIFPGVRLVESDTSRKKHHKSFPYLESGRGSVSLIDYSHDLSFGDVLNEGTDFFACFSD